MPHTLHIDLSNDRPGSLSYELSGQECLAVECDGSGGIQSASLTNFNLSDGDKATLRAERGPDGALRVQVRGDVYDGRGFIKSSMSGPTPSFSTAHLPSRVKKPPRGAIIDPPSMNGGVSAVWTRPPQVRLPTSGPILR